MKLLTENLRAHLKPMSDPGYEPDDPMVHAKFFSSFENLTWLVTAGQASEDDYVFFGYLIGDENEWGSFALSDLEEARLPYGLRIERDADFVPQRFNKLAEYIERMSLSNTNSRLQGTDLSVYSLEELIAFSNTNETMGKELGYAFKVNGDTRPLAQFTAAIERQMIELDRVVLGELLRRDAEAIGQTRETSAERQERIQ